MEERVKMSDLERLVNRLNIIFKLKRTYVKSTASYKGKCFAISSAYGGVKLVLVGKGERTIIGGYMTKKELYMQIIAFENGVEAAKSKSFFKR